MTETLHREAIFPRIDGIRKNLKKLEELAKLDFEAFCQGDALDLAHHKDVVKRDAMMRITIASTAVERYANW
ncbi:MAG: hypothetical protein HY391_04865 [Deltaproteobacteria bacterium]|nr:hypothetical protein [Deltaproteobacteria bacterium]